MQLIVLVSLKKYFTANYTDYKGSVNHNKKHTHIGYWLSEYHLRIGMISCVCGWILLFILLSCPSCLMQP